MKGLQGLKQVCNARTLAQLQITPYLILLVHSAVEQDILCHAMSGNGCATLWQYDVHLNSTYKVHFLVMKVGAEVL